MAQTRSNKARPAERTDTPVLEPHPKPEGQTAATAPVRRPRKAAQGGTKTVPAAKRLARVRGAGKARRAKPSADKASDPAMAHPEPVGPETAATSPPRRGDPKPPVLAVRAAEAASGPAPAADPAQVSSKQARIIELLHRPEGATITQLTQMTGWLPHSVRGVLSGVLKRKLGLAVESRVEPDSGRVYRIGSSSGPATATASPAMPPQHRAASGRRRPIGASGGAG